MQVKATNNTLISIFIDVRIFYYTGTTSNNNEVRRSNSSYNQTNNKHLVQK